jgi:hypothetical protein
MGLRMESRNFCVFRKNFQPISGRCGSTVGGPEIADLGRSSGLNLLAAGREDRDLTTAPAI